MKKELLQKTCDKPYVKHIQASRKALTSDLGGKEKIQDLCCYLDRMNLWAFIVQYECGPTASLRAKDEKEEQEGTHSWNCLPSPNGDLPNL